MPPIERIQFPPWVRLIEDQIDARHLTAEGLTGLMHHARLTNLLGELLAREPDVFLPLLEELVRQRNEKTDLRIFWSSVWSEILGRPVEIPPFPKLRGKTQRAFEGELGPWMYMFLPKGLKIHRIDEFRRSIGVHANDLDLPGRWVAVETLPPMFDGSRGHQYQDVVAEALDMHRTRIASWQQLNSTILPRLARRLGVSQRAVRLPSTLEMTFIANLLDWLRDHRDIDQKEAPALSLGCPEWCQDTSPDSTCAVITTHPGLTSPSKFYFEWLGVDQEEAYWRAMVVLPEAK